MKQKSLHNRTSALVTLGLSAGLLIGHPVFAGSSSYTELEKPVKKAAANKKAGKIKSSFSRNNEAVKIYPDIIKRCMHVVAKENDGKEIDFYAFDLEGTLVQHFKMKQKDHRLINGLAKGRYQYRVFAGDEETANGYFEIR